MRSGSEMRCGAWLLLALLLPFAVGSPVRSEGARLAYLIEQIDYAVAGGQVSRKNHAEDIAKALRGLEFTVQRYQNLKRGEFEAALKEISRDSEGSEASIVYVSGFALGHPDGGGLLPVDVVAGEPLRGSVSVDRLLEVPRGKNLRLVIVDAPEDARAVLGLGAETVYSPFLTIRQTLPANTIGVITSVAPWGGYTSLQPIARTDIYPRNFRLFLGRPGRSVEDVLTKVATSVFYDSQHRQLPRAFGKLDKPFLMTRQDEVSDITAWLKLLAKPTEKGLRGFIADYPDSIYVEFARQKLKELEKD